MLDEDPSARLVEVFNSAKEMWTPRGAAAAAAASSTRPSAGSTPRNSVLNSASRRRSSMAHSFHSIHSKNRQSLNLSAVLQTPQAIEQGNAHLVENFGIPLPVLVVEALSYVERSRDVSARLDPSGWACLVCGRRLFVWRYKLSPGQRYSSAIQCRELTLPPSDLAHKADLVCVLPAEGGDERRVPSAVAVSPEGSVRYWPSVAHDGNSAEISAELHGQECFSLVNCPPHGCILATTTGSLILITFGANSENELICHNLTVAKGVLARFGRRVSSFIFGGNPNQTTEYRLVRVLVANELESREKILYVLTGNRLQKWEIGKDNSDKLILDCDVESFVRDKFVEQVWSRDMIHPHQLKAWLIDMQLSKYGLFVLAGAACPKEPYRLRLALGVLDVRVGIGRPPPSTFSSFVVLPHSEVFHGSASGEGDDDSAAFGYRLLFPDFNSEFACVYKDRTILCIPLMGGEEMDKIELHQPGDHILGSGSYDGFPLFFSNSHGIVAVTSSRQDDSDFTTSTSGFADALSTSENFNLTCTFAELESLATSGEKTSQLKAALLLFCRKDLAHCHTLIQETFPVSAGTDVEINSSLDNAVTSLSRQTIDDFPATDPRWAETISNEPSIVSSSMIILHQLEDKQKAHRLFMRFLNAIGLWDRFRSVTIMGNVVDTRRLLCEHEEKLVAALTLRSIQPQYASLMEAAIKVCLRSRNVTSSGKLTVQDLFYQEVSRIEEIVIALFEVEQDMVADGSMQSAVTTVSSVNNIILSVLRQIAHQRQTRSCEGSASLSFSDADHVPLSASRDPSAFLSLLTKQYRMTLEHAVSAAQDANTCGALYQQIMDLADIVLDGYRCQLRFMEAKGYEGPQIESVLRKYEQDRQALILPLLNAKQYERTAALGEKYLDFDALIRLCEITDNNERLKKYMLQFEDQGFTEFIYNWYLKEGKRGKLLSQPILQSQSLQKFLENHHNLSWLQDIQMENYAKAQRTLKTSALAERNILARKKTMFSISKLCALASDALPEVEDLKEEESLILYQESMPASVLESYGFDVETMRVLTPVELIEFYVCDENVGANEHDFKKALDLLHFVKKDSPDEVERLRLHIWCRSILKDNWDEFDDSSMDNPLEAGAKTVFFRTVELAFSNGMNVKDILPNCEVLLECPSLEEVARNANFRFLIQACYEEIFRVMT